MPYAAKAYTIIVDNNSTFEGTIGSVDKIVFKVNYTFDGKGYTILQTQSLPMKIEGNGTLKNIKLFSTNGFLGNNNTISIAGSAEECVTFIGGGPISGINFNLLDGSSLLFTGVTLSGGTLSITGNAAFLGATIRISGDYIWSKDRMQLNYFFSSGNTLELGSSENSATLTMEDDIVIDTIIQPDKTLKDPQSVTILGNGNTLSVKKLTAANMNNFNFDNVKIKSDSLSVENSIKLNNNTSVTISKDLTFVDYNARIIGDGRTAIHFENDEATISSGKLQNVSLFAKNKLTTNSVFIDTNITAKTVDISSSSFGGGDNTIVSDEISAKESLWIGYNDAQASLTLKKSDGTQGVLKMNDAVLLNLFGKFTGDIIGGKIRILKNDAEFYGKMNVAELEVYGSAFSVSPLQGSHVGTLNLFTSREASEVASIRIDSDLSANILYLRNDVDIASSQPFKKIAGKVAGNGTLKINNASIQIVQSTEVAPDKTAYFDGIKIAALNNDLTFNGDREAKYDFTNNAISAAGKIEFNTPTTFHGASFLTAQNITAKDVAVNGTLTVDGTLKANSISNGTLNIVLPSNGTAETLVTAATVNNVTLTLDLKNVKNKDAQEYRLTDSKDGYTVSDAEENASKILDMVNNNPFADALTDMLDSGNSALQKQALRAIVPTDAAASAFKSAKSTATAVMNTLADRLGGSFEVSGRSGGDLVAGKASVWAQGLLNHAKMTDGFKADTAGFAAGVETNLTDSFKLGAGYAYASTDIKTDRSKTDADTHTGFVYGEYAPDALYVNAMLSFGRSDYDDTTRAAGMKSSYRADAYGARVAAGEKLNRLGFEVGAKAAVRLTNEVEVSLTYDGAFKTHYQDHTGLLNIEVGF